MRQTGHDHAAVPNALIQRHVEARAVLSGAHVAVEINQIPAVILPKTLIKAWSLVLMLLSTNCSRRTAWRVCCRRFRTASLHVDVAAIDAVGVLQRDQTERVGGVVDNGAVDVAALQSGGIVGVIVELVRNVDVAVGDDGDAGPRLTEAEAVPSGL